VLNIYKYSEIFPSLFEKEKKKIKSILGDVCLIEHIGSTAIEGVDGKGIIDILLIFENQNDIESTVKSLQKNGYFLAVDSVKLNGRTFMSSSGIKESDFGDIHLHLAIENSDEYLNTILFRDYLRNHPKERQEYIDLKYKLFKEVAGNRPKYTESKNDFIRKIIASAKKDLL